MARTVEPMERLPGYINAARAQERPVRLVLRNAERFGLVHLYFSGGSLVHVEGHRGPGAPSLGDLRSWRVATIRADALEVVPPAHEPVEQLEAALAHVLHDVAAFDPRTSSPSASQMEPLFGRTSFTPHTNPSLPTIPAVPPVGATGLPPLPGGTQSTPSSTSPSAASDPGALAGDYEQGYGHLSDAQWQLLALAVHEVVSRAGEALGEDVALVFLDQALANIASRRPALRLMQLAQGGWLRPRDATVLRHVEGQELASAVSELLAEYERGCAALLGSARARQLVSEAAAPLRLPLAQLGIGLPTNPVHP